MRISTHHLLPSGAQQKPENPCPAAGKLIYGEGAPQNVPSLTILGTSTPPPRRMWGPKYRQRGHSSAARRENGATDAGFELNSTTT